MLNAIIYLAQNALVIAAAIFAFANGGPAERRGAAWLVLNVLASVITVVLRVTSPTTQLILDGVYALGLLPLAVLHVSWWIGALALLAAASFSLEAAYLVADRPLDITFAQLNNAILFTIVLTFCACGVSNIIKRRRNSRAPQPAPILAVASHTL